MAGKHAPLANRTMEAFPYGPGAFVGKWLDLARRGSAAAWCCQAGDAPGLPTSIGWPGQLIFWATDASTLLAKLMIRSKVSLLVLRRSVMARHCQTGTKLQAAISINKDNKYEKGKRELGSMALRDVL